MTAAPEATPSTGCWAGRSTPSWPWRSSGGRSTAATASSPTVARTWAGCGWRPPRCGAYWLVTTSICRPRRPDRRPGSASPGRSGSNTGPGKCGVGRHPLHALQGGAELLRHHRPGLPQWITTLLSPEETSLQTQVVFLAALEAEGLIDTVEDRLATGELLPAGDQIPILLAVSDNGPPMTAADTRSFMALCSIAHHFGRPGVPTDQPPIESFFGHIKADWPHLETIANPEILGAELDRVRAEFNGVRLHAAIGSVTPDDEHQGRGDATRQARRDGLARADHARRAAPRPMTNTPPGDPS
jgi:Integrase core domain